MTQYQIIQAIITDLEEKIGELEKNNETLQKMCDLLEVEDPELEWSKEKVKELKSRLHKEKARLLNLN